MKIQKERPVCTCWLPKYTVELLERNRRIRYTRRNKRRN